MYIVALQPSLISIKLADIPISGPTGFRCVYWPGGASPSVGTSRPFNGSLGPPCGARD